MKETIIKKLLIVFKCLSKFLQMYGTVAKRKQKHRFQYEVGRS